MCVSERRGERGTCTCPSTRVRDQYWLVTQSLCDVWSLVRGIQVNDTMIMVTNPTKQLLSIITEPRPQNGSGNDQAFNDDDVTHISDCPHLVGNNEADHDLI